MQDLNGFRTEGSFKQSFWAFKNIFHRTARQKNDDEDIKDL